MNKDEFKLKLKSSTEKELYELCKRYIWLSAYAANNPSSDYHWMSDMCYGECYDRKKEKIYSDAYRRTYMSEFGSDPHPEDGPIGNYD